MDVLVYNIPVEILSFNEEKSSILTKQVPLSLRRFIRELLKTKELEDSFIKTTVEIKDKEYLAGIYLRRNPSTIFTLPDPKIHWITSELKREKDLNNRVPVNQLLIYLIKEI